MGMMYWGVSVYLGVGLCLAFFSPYRQIIREGLAETPVESRVDRWMLVLTHVIIHGIAVTLWPVFVFRWFRERRSRKLQDDGFSLGDLRELMEAMGDLSGDKVSGDTFPNGSGRFGYDPTNPIPCKSILGCVSYLSSLRTPEGECVDNQRVGSTSSEVSDMPIDMYRISDMNNREIALLHFSPYQQRNSELAPEGFQLAH